MPIQSIKNSALNSSQTIFDHDPKTLQKGISKVCYYSSFVLSEDKQPASSSIVSDLDSNVLKISLCNMAIYECYLFAFGLSNDFAKEQIIICGGSQKKHMRCKVSPDDILGDKSLRYYYELTMPADTRREEYLQRILDEFNTYFQLDAKVEKVMVVKDSHEIITLGGYSLELIWKDQLIMLLKIKGEILKKRSKSK